MKHSKYKHVQIRLESDGRGKMQRAFPRAEFNFVSPEFYACEFTTSMVSFIENRITYLFCSNSES